MKQDIRKLFEKENLNSSQELPSGHRKEFQQKLRSSRQKKYAFSFLPKIAVMALVIMGTALGIYKFQTQKAYSETSISQIDLIEKQYLKSIESEWQEFISVTNDSTLIRRLDSKLKDLDKDYNKLSKQLKSNPENTTIIQSLIDNLQTRLELLEDIQIHIRILNSKPQDHESIL